MGTSHFVTRPACPACHCGNARVLYRCCFTEPPLKEYLEEFYSPQGGVEFEYLAGAAYLLRECAACGLIYQEEIADGPLMKRLYEKWIDPVRVFAQLTERHGVPYYASYAQEIMQILAFLGKVPAQVSTLDFGMGWGRWALMAKAFGCDSHGLELSEPCVAFARANGIKTLEGTELGRHPFDFINTEQVFEHVPAPAETLNALKESLKPTGLLKISVPDGGDIKRRLSLMDWKAPKGSKNSLNPVAPLEHINCFSRQSLRRMADLAGLEEVVLPLSCQYPFLTGWSGLRASLDKVWLPVKRSLLKRGTYLFFRRVQRD